MFVVYSVLAEGIGTFCYNFVIIFVKFVIQRGVMEVFLLNYFGFRGVKLVLTKLIIELLEHRDSSHGPLFRRVVVEDG